MAVSPAYARTLIGQRVICHSTYGVHGGILHEVRHDGIILRSAQHLGYSSTNANADTSLNIRHADEATKPDVQEAFSPFFFLPFLALAALRPWGYGYGYGYPYGYGYGYPYGYGW